MSVRLLRTFLAVFILGSQLAAQETATHWCGTSEQMIDETRALAIWAESRELPAGKGIAATAARMNGDLFILEPDELLTPFDNPVDLAGRTITFIPESTSAYRILQTPLEYDDELGPSRALPETGDNDFVVHTLETFAFPFQGKWVRDLYISERFGVFLEAPPVAGIRRQFGPLDIATPRQGVIAPYLQSRTPRTLGRHQRELFVKESQEAITITWRAFHDPQFPYNSLNDGAIDIQLVMRANGEIRFSYHTLTNIAWGSVVISSGEETVRAELHTLASVDDPPGDVDPNKTFGNLLDIRQVEFQRIGESELIRVKVKLGGRTFPIDAGWPIMVRLRLDNGTELNLSSFESWRYCVPGWGCSYTGANAEFLDDGVVMYVLDRYLDEPVSFVAETLYFGMIYDSVSHSFSLASGKALDVDLSELTNDTVVDSPVLEAFTVPTLNHEGVWERIREEFGLWDEEVDGVAIFQNFTTDIRTYATAYSTVGNSGADGVWHSDRNDRTGSHLPRRPAILHMNEVEPDRRDEDSLRYREFLLGHELGHRWLYGFNIIENGQPSDMLAPRSSHPAQYVHTPAAFPVYTNRDFSVMGGSNFEDLGAEQFRTPDETGAFGYSWHELYLMGLATSAEVDSWFYLEQTQPRLGDEYHAPPGVTVTGSKVGVSLSQIVESMGARSPAHGESQRNFRVLFVLLAKPGTDTMEDESILAEYAARFTSFFSNATGGRGSVTKSLPLPPVANFTSSLKGLTGHPVAFRDSSTEYPARWSWDFGDGTWSSEQFPSHTYREPGKYVVTLRVQNSRGESVATQSIEIEPSPRRRSVRR